jgi:hypothetical protein
MGFYGLHRCHDLSLILRSALKILSETSFSYPFCSFYWVYCFSNLSGVDDMGVLRSYYYFHVGLPTPSVVLEMEVFEIADGVDALDIEVDRASKVGLADAHLLDQNILLVVSCVPEIF